MATNFSETKSVRLAQIVEDLNSGLTKWKKDDIGFGSIEKKYNLLLSEAVELFNHPKIKNLEHKIPTFVIIDDILDEATAPQVTVPEDVQAQIEVMKEVVQVTTKPVELTTVKLTQPKQENKSLELAF